MENMSRAEMCSWWWASHISPKNSKWLQQNLADMDSKVKQMIKLIEVDEDSFARRAEMYYKKRPELMKLVEELYRAYRALAERYDHATGVIRHAHKTMGEVFPNQVPVLGSVDGLSASSVNDSDPCSPEMSALVQAFWNPGEMDTDEEQESFEKAQGLSECDRLERFETDVNDLKEALSKLNAEKEAGLAQYEQSAQKLCSLETEVLRVQEDSRGFHERASKADAEVMKLKDFLFQLEGEREDSLSQYQQCLDRISSLEGYISSDQKRGCEELARLKNEKETGLGKYMEALEIIAELENKLLLAEEKASLASERADHVQREVVMLKENLARITEEKEAAAFQYQQCLEKIARLENETEERTAKLKSAEEQCLLMERSNNSTKTELESVLLNMGIKNEQLSEKQKDLGRLWTCVQQERLRVEEAKVAHKKLQGFHFQAQGELRSVAAELQEKAQFLKDMEVHNLNLQGEVKLLNDEKSVLISERRVLEMNLEAAHQRQEELATRHADMEIEQVSVLKLVDDLRVSLAAEKKGHDRSTQMSHLQMAEMESKVCVLQDKLGEELDEAANAQLEIFILRNTVQDLREANSSLHVNNEKLILKVRQGNQKEDFLVSEVESLKEKLREVQGVRDNLEKENCRILAENGFLSKARLKTEFTLDTILLIFKNNMAERSEAVHQLFDNNLVLKDKVMIMNQTLAEYQTENMSLRASLETYDDELREVKTAKGSLETEICRMNEEHKETNKMAEFWESVAGTTFVELQTSSICEALYREKFFELTKEYQFLVDKSYADGLEAVQQQEISLRNHLSGGSIMDFPEEEQSVSERHLNTSSGSQEAKSELAMKDIMLDQASEVSSRRTDRNTWYNNAESEIVELRVDSLEISKRYTELDEAESNSKLLERLSSDANKLTNLQVTVHDLKQRVVMITESSIPTKGKDAEYSHVTEQLNEAEKTIVKLQKMNGKLVQHVEDCPTGSPFWPTSSPISDPSKMEETERMRRKVCEEARKCSENTGILQVKVQKLQFLLLKLDRGNTIGRSSGIRILDRERKVPLRDYLYGRETRSPHRRRRASFCCVQPLNSEDSA